MTKTVQTAVNRTRAKMLAARAIFHTGDNALAEVHRLASWGSLKLIDEAQARAEQCFADAERHLVEACAELRLLRKMVWPNSDALDEDAPRLSVVR